MIEQMHTSKNHSNTLINKTQEGLAYFWRAEIASKSGDYTTSINLMNRFMSYDEISQYQKLRLLQYRLQLL
jgi:uncharacterized membrane protein YukC